MTESAINKYDTVAMSLHWLIAALMIYMLFFGEDLMRDRSGGTFPPSLHVSIGAAILVLSLFRLAWRWHNPPPGLPDTMPLWEKRASITGHIIFYMLLIGLPLTGWLAFPAFLGKHPEMAGVLVISAMPVPPAPNLGLPMGGIHDLLGKLGIALLILHVAAALKHQFVNRDGVARRMIPY